MYLVFDEDGEGDKLTVEVGSTRPHVENSCHNIELIIEDR